MENMLNVKYLILYIDVVSIVRYSWMKVNLIELNIYFSDF